MTNPKQLLDAIERYGAAIVAQVEQIRQEEFNDDGKFSPVLWPEFDPSKMSNIAYLFLWRHAGEGTEVDLLRRYFIEVEGYNQKIPEADVEALRGAVNSLVTRRKLASPWRK